MILKIKNLKTHVPFVFYYSKNLFLSESGEFSKTLYCSITRLFSVIYLDISK